MNLTKPFIDCYWSIRIDLYARQVAQDVLPELRQAALRRFADKPTGTDAKAYIDTRAAQLAQPLVDEILRADPGIPGFLGNRLIVAAAGKAATQIAKTNRHRSAA